MKEYFENLKDYEKKALIIYKSRIGLAINDINNDKIVNDTYDHYKKIFSNLYNITYKYFPFDIVDFTDIDSFRESLYKIKDIINLIEPYITSKPLTLYRCINTNKSNRISKDNIISTTDNLRQTYKFLDKNKNGCTLFEINIPSNSPILFCPYNFKYDNEKNLLKLVNYDNQQEYILRNSDYNFNLVDTINTGKLEMKIIDGVSKKKTKKYTM